MESGPGWFVTRRWRKAGKVRCQVARSKAHVCIVELVAAVGLDPPGVWVPRHDDETRALTTGLVQAVEAPQERAARNRKLWA